MTPNSQGEGARGDLFKELKVPAEDAPGEAEYAALLDKLRRRSDDLPSELGPDIVQRLLISLRTVENEATMHRLTEVMSSYGYRLDESDPDHVVFKKF